MISFSLVDLWALSALSVFLASSASFSALSFSGGMSSLSLSIRRFDSSSFKGIVRSFRLGMSIFTLPFLSKPTDRMSLSLTSMGTIVWNSRPMLSLNAGFASISFSSSSLAPCFRSTSSCVV